MLAYRPAPLTWINYQQEDIRGAVRTLHRFFMAIDLRSRGFYLDLGEKYFKARRIHDALAVYKEAIAHNPHDAGFHNNLAICQLLLGNFSEGWPEYEWRLKIAEFAHMKFAPIPFWKGEPLDQKGIAIMPEQGLGDTIHFVRYVPLLKATGATVILGCRKPLYKLLLGVADAIGIIGEPGFSYRVHCQVSLMSLPYLFGTTLETIPDQVPYLKIPVDAGQEAVSRITASSKNLRVGLVWQGASNRSLHLKQLIPLLGISEIQFFSLQKGQATNEIESIREGKIVNLDPYLPDFVDTAAAIQALDLVIAIDTSVAHLAGALAKRVWTLIPFVPDWRWMLNREDSPWYPTMRLFRQPAPGDWASIIRRVSEELRTLVGAK